MFKRLFLDHPRSVGESYPQHAGAALSFGARLFLVSLACIVHALVPALFVTTGSRTVETLHRRMVRDRRPAAPTTASARLQAD